VRACSWAIARRSSAVNSFSFMLLISPTTSTGRPTRKEVVYLPGASARAGHKKDALGRLPRTSNRDVFCRGRRQLVPPSSPTPRWPTSNGITAELTLIVCLDPEGVMEMRSPFRAAAQSSSFVLSGFHLGGSKLGQRR
jgi:hypothetical protein